MAVSELPKHPAVAERADPVRVLMLCYEYPPLGGGTAAACSYLLAELVLTDAVEVDLVTSGTQPQVERVDLGPHVRIHRLPVAKIDPRFWRARELAEWLWRALPYAGALARRQRFDIAHCWAGWPSGVVGWRLQLHTRLPYIVSLRGSDVPGYNERLRWLDLPLRPFVRRIWRDAAHVSALSADLRALAWQTEPGLAIDVIPNGVDTRRFTPVGRGERNDILFAGRLIRRKGVAYLLEAYAGLGDLPRRPRLLIAGDGPERAALEALSRRLGIADSVVFLGHLERDRLAQVYGEAGIFVLPSLAEALSNVVPEAMASGEAIVTTATGAREVLQDNGLVVPPGNSAALRDALRRYLTDSLLLLRHQNRSRRVALEMSWPAVAEWNIGVYRRVLAAAALRSCMLACLTFGCV
jgi:glycosyltransferase involved in cell wall biosynthesis